MKRDAVSSQNVASVGYDQQTQTLEVEFHNGSVYQYFDVPQHVYQQLVGGVSVGKYLNEEIKGNYRYARL